MAIIRGTRAIAKYMGWKSKTTVVRNLAKYPPNSPYAHLNFPVKIFPTNRRPGFEFGADPMLIAEWMRRKGPNDELLRLKYRAKEQRISPDSRLSKLALKRQMEQQMDHRDGPEKPLTLQARKRPLHEELRWDSLQPGEKAYIKARELSAEELEEIERYEAKKCGPG